MRWRLPKTSFSPQTPNSRKGAFIFFFFCNNFYITLKNSFFMGSWSSGHDATFTGLMSPVRTWAGPLSTKEPPVKDGWDYVPIVTGGLSETLCVSEHHQKLKLLRLSHKKRLAFLSARNVRISEQLRIPLFHPLEVSGILTFKKSS